MRRKKIKRIFAIILICLLFPCFMTLTSCGALSAYEIAVNNGFVGTEEEWIESLRGKSAYEIAVENGFTGTEQEWLDSLQGTNGEDAETTTLDTYQMYLSAIENGEIDGNEITYLQFLKDVFSSSSDETYSTLAQNLFSVVSVYCYVYKNTSAYSSAGTGVIYKISDTDCSYIITNYHVTYNSSTKGFYPYYKLYLYGQDTAIEATCVGGSKLYDIAVLKVENSEVLIECNAQEIQFSDDDVSLGQVCYSIGNTSEYGLTVTRGIVSVESEIISMTIGGLSASHREIRHDSYIYHGNSGGGLFDSNGKFIGLTNGGRDGTMMNYAIPTNIVKSVTENVIKNCNDENECIKVYLTGIENNLVASNTQTIYNSETCKIITKETIIISSIDEDSLFSRTDIQAGDEVVKIVYNGIEYDNYSNFKLRSYTLGELLLSSSSGDVIEIYVERTNGNGDVEEIYDKIVLSELYYEYVN